MIKPKHIPIRTCVACRTTDAKRGLLRVVRQPDGVVVYDPKGKMPGRGAYVCAQPACIALARKQKKLERSLKAAPIPESLFLEPNAQAVRLGRVSGSASPGSPPEGDDVAGLQDAAPPVAPRGAKALAEEAEEKRAEDCGTGPRESEE